MAEANYRTARAAYRQVIGVEPGRLQPATSVDRLFPGTLAAVTSVGIADHPTVATAQNNVDVALFQVKIAEGALYPTLSLLGICAEELRSRDDHAGVLHGLGGNPTGGADLSGRRRILADPAGQGNARPAAASIWIVARDQIRLTIAQAWAQLDAAKGAIISTQAQVKSSEAALNGVREEARLGQRTTLDVLNAQQELVNSRVALVSAQRDRVVNSYTVLAAIGRLAPGVLGLHVASYDSQTHYHQVRDAWFGVRTPDGR